MNINRLKRKFRKGTLFHVKGGSLPIRNISLGVRTEKEPMIDKPVTRVLYKAGDRIEGALITACIRVNKKGEIF